MAAKQSAIQKSMKVISVMKKKKGSTNGKGKYTSKGAVVYKKPASSHAAKLTSMKAMKSKGPQKTTKSNKPEYIHVSDYMIVEEKKRRLWLEWYDMKMYNRSFGVGAEKWSSYYRENKNRPIEDMLES